MSDGSIVVVRSNGLVLEQLVQDGRTFSPEDAAKILIKAEAVHLLPGEETHTRRINELINMLRKRASPEGDIGVQILYEAAECRRVPRGAVQRALHIVYPTVEQRYADTAQYGTEATPPMLYNSFMRELMQVIRKGFPSESETIHYRERGHSSDDASVVNDVRVIQIQRVQVPQNRFRRLRKPREVETVHEFMGIDWQVDRHKKKIEAGVSVRLYDARVLPACGEALQQIPQRMDGRIQYNVMLQYYETTPANQKLPDLAHSIHS